MKREEIEKLYDRLQKNMPADMVFHTEDGAVVRRFIPHERLILLGGGHVAQALCMFASQLEFDVTVVDDRPGFANREKFSSAKQIICGEFAETIEKLALTEFDYVAVLTRGHRWDRTCLEAIAKGSIPYYIGQIGSRRRVQGLFSLMEQEAGIKREFLEKIHTPIGLDIGAQTPKEIAISILAELIQMRNEKKEDSTLMQKNMEEELFLDILSAKSEDELEQRVLAVIVDTKGSVPAKTGSVMSCNLLGRTAGTVGGGCGENAVIQEAREAVRTGIPRMINVDMTADISEEEGMVCGGHMKVWIEPVV